MAMALFTAHLSIQRCLQSIVPDKRATSNLHCGDVYNFAQSLSKFERTMRIGISQAAEKRQVRGQTSRLPKARP